MHSPLRNAASVVALSLLGALAFAGPSVANADTPNLLNNPGAETGTLDGWNVGGDSNPGVDNGSFDSSIKPHSGSYDFYGHTGALGTLSQSVSLVGNQGITASQIDSGTLVANVSFWEIGLNQGNPSDDGQVTVKFVGNGGGVLAVHSTPVVDSHGGNWQQSFTSFRIPVGTRSIDYTMNFIRHEGSDNDSFIDDNELVISSKPRAAG